MIDPGWPAGHIFFSRRSRGRESAGSEQMEHAGGETIPLTSEVFRLPPVSIRAVAVYAAMSEDAGIPRAPFANSGRDWAPPFCRPFANEPRAALIMLLRER